MVVVIVFAQALVRVASRDDRPVRVDFGGDRRPDGVGGQRDVLHPARGRPPERAARCPADGGRAVGTDGQRDTVQSRRGAHVAQAAHAFGRRPAERLLGAEGRAALADDRVPVGADVVGHAVGVGGVVGVVGVVEHPQRLHAPRRRPAERPELRAHLAAAAAVADDDVAVGADAGRTAVDQAVGARFQRAQSLQPAGAGPTECLVAQVGAAGADDDRPVGADPGREALEFPARQVAQPLETGGRRRRRDR